MPSTNLRGSPRGWWGRRLFVLAFFVLVAVMAAAVPKGTAADSQYLNVWVHYDYMVGADGSFAPSASAMQLVVDSFKAHGVTLHIDSQHTAIPERKVVVPDWPSEYASRPGFDDPACTGSDAVRFSDLKKKYFQPSSNHPWHYAIFGDFVYTDSSADANNCPATLETGGTPPLFGMTGDSEVGFGDVPPWAGGVPGDLGDVRGGFGYNFVVTLGAYRLAGVPVPDRTTAGVFMHELGHNLGLRHGGAPVDPNDYQDNYKPNYLSVMSYAFTNTGIPYAASQGSIAIAGYRVDYSDVKLPDLNERNLDESIGVQDTAHPADITYGNGDGFCDTPVSALGPVDWNGDGNTTDAHLSWDINCDFGGLTLLRGSDDWAWIHAWLAPPVITGMDPFAHVGYGLHIKGINLQGPATVVFSGGASATGFHSAFGNTWDGSANTGFDVTVPVGAKSGPITVITPQAKTTSSQSLQVFTTPPRGATGITAGPDGNLWFTTFNSNLVGRITPAGTIAEFPIPTPSGLQGITAGPDGNLWFCEQSANKIGRITPNGTITEFAGANGPETITAGPDGNLWFTESPWTSVGRITPSGTITQFPLPLTDSADTITAGPDGNLWFTDTGDHNSIGRITPAGVVTEYPTPIGGISPRGITAGPDGNLWFTEGFSNTIGRITTSGTATDFPVPSDCFSCEPDEITAGPDGNLWYTTLNSDNIARFTPSGAVSEFPTPTFASGPYFIAAGPDGNLWFTELHAGNIGRITPTGQINEFPIP